MDRVMRARPSSSMVVALIALFVALIGTAQAVDGPLPGQNQVGSADVINNDVRSEDIRDANLTTADIRAEAVTGGKIAADAVTAGKIADGSLGTAEFSSSIPAARATHSANQAIPSGLLIVLPFDSERYDTANLHDESTNNSRLTAPVTGIYAVTAQVEWSQQNVGSRYMELRRAGTLTRIAKERMVAVGGHPTHQELTTQVRLGAGEGVELAVQQDADTDVFIHALREYSPDLSMTWLAPGP
jgi:hypothetical protein